MWTYLDFGRFRYISFWFCYKLWCILYCEIHLFCICGLVQVVVSVYTDFATGFGRFFSEKFRKKSGCWCSKFIKKNAAISPATSRWGNASHKRQNSRDQKVNKSQNITRFTPATSRWGISSFSQQRSTSQGKSKY